MKSANAIVHLFEKELGETVLGAVKYAELIFLITIIIFFLAENMNE